MLKIISCYVYLMLHNLINQSNIKHSTWKIMCCLFLHERPNQIHFQYSYICISNMKFLSNDHINISVTFVLRIIAGEKFAVSTLGSWIFLGWREYVSGWEAREETLMNLHDIFEIHFCGILSFSEFPWHPIYYEDVCNLKMIVYE